MFLWVDLEITRSTKLILPMVARLPAESSSSPAALQYTVMMECDLLDSRFSSWLPFRLCCMPRLITYTEHHRSF